MADVIRASHGETPKEWVGKRFQRKGLDFTRGFLLAVPVSILVWAILAILVVIRLGRLQRRADTPILQ